jgi:octaprenyl-diphosphate synthase
MIKLARSIAKEQSRIQAVLERETAELPSSVRPVAQHVLGAGGKRIRPLLTILSGRLFGSRHEDIYTLAAAVEFFHVATLLHDDVLDSALTRRGSAAAHTVFGVVPSILAGDAMLAHAACVISRMGDARLTRCIGETILNTASGEVEEFARLGDVALPHEAYLRIITGKTAWALRAACELAALRAGADDEAVAAVAGFGLELGVAFQIVDDALDIAPEKVTGKPAGGDLRERKCTPLSRMYWESLPPAEAKRFAARFRDGDFSGAELEAVVGAMRAAGLDNKVRVLAEEHLDRARAALLKLPAGKERDVMALLPDFVRDRNT